MATAVVAAPTTLGQPGRGEDEKAAQRVEIACVSRALRGLMPSHCFAIARSVGWKPVGPRLLDAPRPHDLRHEAEATAEANVCSALVHHGDGRLAGRRRGCLTKKGEMARDVMIGCYAADLGLFDCATLGRERAPGAETAA